MNPLTPARILRLWEAGMRRHPIDRALLLFAAAAPAKPPDSLAEESLGERNAALLALRREHFGDVLQGFADCAACGERMELALHVADLPPHARADGPVEVRGLRFARPTSRHLARAVLAPDAESAADALLVACAETPAALPDDRSTLLAEVGAALEVADPWADLVLAVACPACEREVTVALDLPALVWEEIDACARRLLDDVHTLASAYGWSERDILDLSDARRGAYLARIDR